MSLEIPDIKVFTPEPEPIPENKTENNEKECPKYTELKEKIIKAMAEFKDLKKHMICVKLDHPPSQKLIKEIEAKEYTIKYEVAYDGKEHIGNLRIYRPGYIPSGMGEVFDVFTTSINVEPQLEDKVKNIFDKFMQMQI